MSEPMDGEAGGSAEPERRPTPIGLSVAAIRDLFRAEARELLCGMGEKLAALDAQVDDHGALAELAARSHALKGSAALAELPCLSQAGAVLQRAAELAAEAAQRNHDAARALLQATRAALGPAQRMLDECIEGSRESQDVLLAELLDAFDPGQRSELEAALRADDTAGGAAPEYEERPIAPTPLDETDLDVEQPSGCMADSDIDPAFRAVLLETFELELRELLSEVPDLLVRMADPAQQSDLCADLARIFHTIKGSAATVGRDDLRELAYTLQQAFEMPGEEASPLARLCAAIPEIGGALGAVFLAAGLEPPGSSLEILAQSLRSSLVDAGDEAAVPIGRSGLDAPAQRTPGASVPAAGSGPPDAPPGVDLADGMAARSDHPEQPGGHGDGGPGAAVEPEIMEAFLLDADAALEASETALLHLERNPSDRQALRSLFRQFHTLKGAAAAVGLTRISDQLHAGETLLESIVEGAARLDPEAVVDLLLEMIDSVAGLIAEARGVAHEHRILDDVASRIDELLEAAATGAASSTSMPGAAEAAAPALAPGHPTMREGQPLAAATPIELVPAASNGSAPSMPDPESAIVRVHASRLDLLMNRVSELVVSRTRMEDTMGAVHELEDKLGSGRLRLHEAVEGLRGFEFNPASAGGEAAPTGLSPPDGAGDFTDLEFDKYDDFHLLARTLVELAADAGEIVEQLSGLIETLADETRQVSKVTSSLQRTITGMRLLSLDTLFRRLQRPTREAARQAGRPVELVCVGGEVQVDRALIESLYGPLLHLVRNAVSHGIEPLVERRAVGKPDLGRIELRATQRHGSVEITMRDDGHGLDFAAIRAKAERLGLVDAGATPPREELAALIFRPGFSTRSEVTGLAGRGIGMDVVAAEVEQLRGAVSVESHDGKGALFRITLPLTAVIDQVLVLRVGRQVFALPHGPIESVLNIDAEHLSWELGRPRLRIGEETIAAIDLAAVADLARTGPPATAVVLRSAEHRIALLVDRIEAQREAVVRPLGRLFAGHPFVTSATFAGDGQVIFVLDASRLEAWLGTCGGEPDAGAPPSQATAEPAAVAEDAEAAVLWADDSISVRKLAAHFLTAEGWTSRTAVDGRDALDKLRGGRFKVVVTDLEMPRMHGYELLHEIRNDPQLRHLPVIVCSSRSSEKHRRAATEAGADGYLTKPFTREALAAALRELVGTSPC